MSTKTEVATVSQEDRLLAALLNGKQADALQDILPMDSEDSKGIFGTIDLCCGALVRMNKTADQLKPLLGRALVVVRDNRLYTERNFASFDEYLRKHISAAFPLERSQLYECMRIAKRCPTLTLEEFGRVGITKIGVLTRFTDFSDLSAAARIKLVDRAEKMTADGLTAWAVEKKFIEKGDTKKTTLILVVKKSVANRWKKFKEEVWAQAKSGGDDGTLLDAMMQECASWEAEHEEQVRAKP